MKCLGWNRLPRWPITQRSANFPLVAEWVDDPPEPPSVFVLDRGSFDCAGVDCRGNNGLRGVHDEERSACRASEIVGAEALHGWVSARHPERSVPCRELNDDVVAVADLVEHFCPESPFVERNRGAGTVDPELRLKTRNRSSLR